MKKRRLADLMTNHLYKKLPVTMKMWMQFNVMPRTAQIKYSINLYKFITL